MGGSIWDMIAPIAGAALGSIVPGVGTALGAGIGSGLGTGIRTGNPVAGLLSAGGSYLGGSLGGEFSPGNFNPIGGSIGPPMIGSGTLGSTLGSTASNILGPAIANTSLGSIAGSSIGSSLGESVGTSLMPPDMGGGQSQPSAPPPFAASQMGSMALPPSLSQFAGLSPEQQTSNIATKGVYGGGEGNEESKYFLNLINRRLVDPQGKVGNLSQVNPVENSFLSQLGLGGYNNPNDLLQGISKWGTA